MFMSSLMSHPVVTIEKLYFNGSYNLSVQGGTSVFVPLKELNVV